MFVVVEVQGEISGGGEVLLRLMADAVLVRHEALADIPVSVLVMRGKLWEVAAEKLRPWETWSVIFPRSQELCSPTSLTLPPFFGHRR